MRQVRLGQTDLDVSSIAFGTWAFGGDWGTADLEESRNAVHHALELGINLFDTGRIASAVAVLADAAGVIGTGLAIVLLLKG